MMTQYALSRQADHLEQLFYSAFVQIGDNLKPMPMSKMREGNKVYCLIDVPKTETGIITKVIIKDVNEKIVWESQASINSLADDFTVVIPIEPIWREGE
ncbi:hypothetical protein ACT91Q_01625 [Brevibacillus thermoruber]|jgi:hypothetical protein|uniref:hypothetical protein n=1 Tax=Brevibacillus thermoruber TaxID=33942 RepID=UPI004041CA1B